jgi:hypothetical protein
MSPQRQQAPERRSVSVGETVGVLACFVLAGSILSIGWVLSATAVLAL